MGSLTIRNLDDELKQKLRVRGAQRGASMEEEARSILRAVVGADLSVEALAAPVPKESAWDAIQRFREKYGTFELEIPERGTMACDVVGARDRELDIQPTRSDRWLP